MGEIQRALNILGGTLAGGAASLATGLKFGTKESEPKVKTPEKPKAEGQYNPNLSYFTRSNILSSDEAAEMAFTAANNAIIEKARAKQLRDVKGRFSKDVGETGKLEKAGGKIYGTTNN